MGYLVRYAEFAKWCPNIAVLHSVQSITKRLGATNQTIRSSITLTSTILALTPSYSERPVPTGWDNERRSPTCEQWNKN